METVIIVIHLMVIIALVALVLMQRSEGGALGIGGGGNNFMTTRGQGNVLTRSTAILAAVFFVTSLGMGILARMHEKPSQILDSVPAAGTSQPAPAGTAPATGTGTILDQLNNLPKSAPQLPSTDGTTLPGSQPAAPATPQVPTGQ
jgi:preprotein translocase subunit SecG